MNDYKTKTGVPNTSQRYKTYYSPGQDIRFILTTPDEERSLFEMAKKTGGDVEPARKFLREHKVPVHGDEAETARIFIITNHLLFAKMDAEGQVKSRALGADEVVSAANFAVMKAYDGFQHRKGYRFTTYLRHFIRGEIASLWKTKFNGDIADPSICGPTDGSFVPADNSTAWTPDDRNSDLSEDHPGEGMDLKSFNREKLAAAMSQLSVRDADLMRLAYVEDMGFAEIGRLRGVTREAVRATHARIIKRLRTLLSKDGVSDLE
jgi:RNA polymerase sigma factor (sigma-70 family)